MRITRVHLDAWKEMEFFIPADYFCDCLLIYIYPTHPCDSVNQHKCCLQFTGEVLCTPFHPAPLEYRQLYIYSSVCNYTLLCFISACCHIFFLTPPPSPSSQTHQVLLFLHSLIPCPQCKLLKTLGKLRAPNQDIMVVDLLISC